MTSTLTVLGCSGVDLDKSKTNSAQNTNGVAGILTESVQALKNAQVLVF